jgi:hypothetical protein
MDVSSVEVLGSSNYAILWLSGANTFYISPEAVLMVSLGGALYPYGLSSRWQSLHTYFRPLSCWSQLSGGIKHDLLMAALQDMDPYDLYRLVV